MIIQYIIIVIVLLISIAYAVWRIHKALKVKSGDPCYGCALRKVCRKDLTKVDLNGCKQHNYAKKS